MAVQGDDRVETALPFEEMLWSPERAPLSAKFAVVATSLFPESAVKDAHVFRELKKARDRLSHGALREEADVPAQTAVELLETYVTGAAERLGFT